MTGSHLPNIPSEMSYTLDERLQHLKEPIAELLSRDLILRSPTRVACYSNPADVIYLATKDGRLLRNEVGLAPDWTLDVRSIREKAISTAWPKYLLSFIFGSPSEHIALQKYRSMTWVR